MNYESDVCLVSLSKIGLMKELYNNEQMNYLFIMLIGRTSLNIYKEK